MSDPDLPAPEIVVETTKNRVLIFRDRVVKTYKPTRRSAKHARREAAALRRLDGLAGVPRLLEVRENGQTLVMSRVPGVAVAEGTRISDGDLLALRDLVEQTLARGVARHSLPRRDVLVRPGGGIGLVDFERSSRRMCRADPVWPIACIVTRFNLLRFVNGYAPHLLSAREQVWLRRHVRMRSALQHAQRFKRRLFRLVGLAQPDTPGSPGKQR